MGNDSFAAAVRIVFSQQEREKEHDAGDDRQNPEYIEIGKGSSLRLEPLICPGVSMRLRIGQGLPGLDVSLRLPDDQVIKTLVRRGRVAYQDVLMILGAACDESSNHRRAHAASDVTEEIDHARHCVAFLSCYSYIRHQRDGHEKEAQPDLLDHAQPGSGNEADLQIDAHG